MKSLSTRQQRILSFIQRFVEERSYPPTIRDILRGCNISSTSVVDYNLKILAREGHLRRDPEVSRGILCGHPVPRYAVPLIGYIAAGQPIPVPSAETWDDVASSEALELTEELVGGREGVYALRVKGDSRVDALINDGDIVLMQHTNTADDGELAAAWLKAEKEVTLKKLYREGDRVRLQPANTQMQPLYVDTDNVEVQGRVIGVIRQLV